MDLFCDNFLIIKSCDPTIYKPSLLSIKPYINDKVGLFLLCILSYLKHSHIKIKN